MDGASSQFNLHCTICPKKPVFSDTSHLLTHVSSKGHLFQVHIVRTRSANDLRARHDIAIYDQWYLENDVQTLVNERLTQKAAKKTKSRASQDSASASTTTTTSTSSKVPAGKKRKTASTAASKTVPSPLDINSSYKPITPIKTQVDTPIDTKFDVSQLEASFHSNDFAANPISTNPFAFVTPKPKSDYPQNYPWSLQRPSSFDALPVHIPSSPPPLAWYLRAAPMAPMFTRPPQFVDDDEEDEEMISEATRLKGVYWPGMNIFDAATPDTKRKRNQKKSSAVALSLERQSTYVEANELIFTPTGTFRKSRPITGQAEQDSSPYKLEIPTPKHSRKRQTRPALAPKDTNAPLRHSSRPSIAPTPFQGFGPITNADMKPTGLRSSACKSTKSHNFRSNAMKADSKGRKRDFSIFSDPGDQDGEDKTKAAMLQGPFHQRNSASFGGGSGSLGATPRLPALNSGYSGSPFQNSPQFNPNLPRGLSIFDLRHPGHHHPQMYQNNYFSEAFEHYQPAMPTLPQHGMPYSYPFYGYGYYAPPPPPPGYEMPSFAPMGHQQAPPPPQQPRQTPQPPQTPISHNKASKSGRRSNKTVAKSIEDEDDNDVMIEPSKFESRFEHSRSDA